MTCTLPLFYTPHCCICTWEGQVRLLALQQEQRMHTKERKTNKHKQSCKTEWKLQPNWIHLFTNAWSYRKFSWNGKRSHPLAANLCLWQIWGDTVWGCRGTHNCTSHWILETSKGVEICWYLEYWREDARDIRFKTQGEPVFSSCAPFYIIVAALAVAEPVTLP